MRTGPDDCLDKLLFTDGAFDLCHLCPRYSQFGTEYVFYFLCRLGVLGYAVFEERVRAMLNAENFAVILGISAPVNYFSR
jgi:hypothetical protein